MARKVRSGTPLPPVTLARPTNVETKTTTVTNSPCDTRVPMTTAVHTRAESIEIGKGSVRTGTNPVGTVWTAIDMTEVGLNVTVPTAIDQSENGYVAIGIGIGTGIGMIAFGAVLVRVATTMVTIEGRANTGVGVRTVGALSVGTGTAVQTRMTPAKKKAGRCMAYLLAGYGRGQGWAT